MIARFVLNTLPRVEKVYSVTRHTVWQIADPHHILLYIQNGACIVELDGTPFLLKKGDIFIIPKNTLYTRKPADENLCTILYVHFDGEGDLISNELAEEEISELYDEVNERLFNYEHFGINSTFLFVKQHLQIADKQAEMDKLFDDALISCRTNTVCTPIELSVFLLRVLLICGELTLKDLLKPNRLIREREIPDNLRGAIMYIHHHYSEKISLSDLCRECAISKQQMIRYFRTYLNTTPNEYITAYRINKARELLMNARQMNVKEISAELGFDDQCYFSRVFSKNTGESPMQFRTRVIAFNEQKHIGENKRQCGECTVDNVDKG